MVDVRCVTKLELAEVEQWPNKLPVLPRVGDFVQSAHTWPRGNTQLELVISRVRWVRDGKQWLAELLLELPPRRYAGPESFAHWYQTLSTAPIPIGAK